MKNDSPEIYTCEFAPEIIDFLYGEMNGERKNAFNMHLRSCTDCADEVADFSDLRFSIQDWKTEFNKIETPEIVIPYETTAIVKVVETEKASWFDGLRNYLTLSPILSGAMAVLILALLVGLGYFVLTEKGNNQSVDIATANDNTRIKNKPVETPRKVVETLKETADNNVKEAKDKDSLVDKTDQGDVGFKNPVPVKTDSKSAPKQKSQSVKTVERKNQTADSSVKSSTDKKVVPSKNKPRLNELPEEDEDNSLRLADLFAELDTRE